MTTIESLDNGNANETSMKQRMEILLQQGDDSSSAAYSQERTLVAWILLSRLADDELDNTWQEHATSLFIPWATHWLPEACQESPETCDLYLRLVAQVTGRLEEFPSVLGKSLFQVWQQRPLASPMVHVDVLSSLQVWMEQDTAEAEASGVLGTIWNHYARHVHVQPPEETENTKKEEPQPPKDIDDSDDKDWKVLGQTLESILNDASSVQPKNAMNAWHETILGMIQSYSQDLLPDFMLGSVLEWMATQSSSLLPSIRMGWHEWFLTLIQTRVPYDEPLRRILLQPSNASNLTSYMTQLLLAHIVSPDPTHAATRALAWQATVVLVESCGWNWMLQTDSKTASSALGAGTHLCTFVRLASGEWRIQLQQEASTSNDNNASAWQQATGLALGHACARLLLGVVQYCAQLEDSPHRMPLSSDALMHLKQSLQDALWTTVEYLQEGEEDDAETKSFTLIATQLLGTLLTEVDVWSYQETNDEDGDSSSPVQGILACLKTSMFLGDHSQENYAIWLPGLAHLLGNAEDDPSRVAQLTGMWEPFIEFLQNYWQRDDDSETSKLAERLDDSVAWACSCTEYIVALHGTERRLALAIVEWIQQVLAKVETSRQELHNDKALFQTLQSYLSLAIGCYMTLSQGQDKEPGKHESRVIFRALQLCEVQLPTA
jgi:hypothetical protein